MDYFPRKYLSKYLTDTIDFNKHDINIFINDKWRKYAGGDMNYKSTWTLLLTNEKAKPTFSLIRALAIRASVHDKPCDLQEQHFVAQIFYTHN
jgi:hypothetical protein